MNENYMYLHCDEWESRASMNPCYDNRMYRKRAGRRAMWKTLTYSPRLNPWDSGIWRHAILDGLAVSIRTGRCPAQMEG